LSPSEVREGRKTQTAKHRAVVLATTRTKLTGRRRYDLQLRLTYAGRHIVRLHRSLTVTVFAYARDRSNNRGTAIAESRIRR
jgi:hypothetical protein